VPGQSLLVKLDDRLRTLHVSLPSRNQISLVRTFPLDEKHQLSRGVCGANDPLGVKIAVEAPWAVIIRLLLLFSLLASGGGRDGLALAGFLLLLGGLLLVLSLELCDQVLAVQVLNRLPGVILVSVALPLEEVLRLARLGDALVHHLLDGIFLLLLTGFLGRMIISRHSVSKSKGQLKGCVVFIIQFPAFVYDNNRLSRNKTKRFRMPKDENPPQGFKYIDNTTRVTINDVIDNN